MEPGREAPEGRPRQALIAWTEALAGPVASWSDRSHAHGVTEVWRAETGAGPLWVKVHSQARKYANEAWAFANLVPWLAGRGHRVPSLLGADRSLRVVAISHLDGAPFETVAPERWPELYRAAGAVLAEVHRAPFPSEDPVPLEAALRQRSDAWCAAAEGLVSPQRIARVRALMDAPGAFDGAERVVCHRDFSPRNWLVGEDGLQLIDFEHCQRDLWLVDLQRLEDRDFGPRPDLRAAFYEGYGREPTPHERAMLLRLRWFFAMSTVAWASAHGDPEFEAEGRAILDRLESLEDGDGILQSAG